MSQVLTANFSMRQLEFLLLDTVGANTTPWDVLFGAAGLAGLDRSLSNGTGANKISKGWYYRQASIAAAANDDWVIGSGGTTCLDRFGNVVTFTLVKWFLLRIVGALTGNKLVMGAAAANPAVLWFGDAASDTEDCHDFVFKVNQIDGWAVAAGKKLRINNPTGGALSYDILILGE